MKLYAIGFTKKTAEEFFCLLKQHGVERMIDIRLHNSNQLAGFTKRDDLRFFLQAILNCEYHHFDFLAPTEEMFREYRKNCDWQLYEKRFMQLMESRKAMEQLDSQFFREKPCCFLCSEATPEYCHRRLVAEMLAKNWRSVEIIHL